MPPMLVVGVQMLPMNGTLQQNAAEGGQALADAQTAVSPKPHGPLARHRPPPRVVQQAPPLHIALLVQAPPAARQKPAAKVGMVAQVPVPQSPLVWHATPWLAAHDGWQLVVSMVPARVAQHCMPLAQSACRAQESVEPMQAPGATQEGVVPMTQQT